MRNPSFLLNPSAYVFDNPSEPAKSTRCKWELLARKGGLFYLVSIWIYNITWDLDEFSFILVSPKCLYSSPNLL